MKIERNDVNNHVLVTDDNGGRMHISSDKYLSEDEVKEFYVAIKGIFKEDTSDD